MSVNKERKSMIKVRGGYSDRNGYNPVCNVAQVDDLDDRTRAILSNEVFQIVDIVLDFSEKRGYDTTNYYRGQAFLKEVMSEVFGDINYLDGRLYWGNVFARIDKVIREAVINEVLDIIEFICGWLNNFCKAQRAQAQKSHGYCNERYKVVSFLYINSVFERECVGYRFVNGEIIKNIDETEITAIEEASSTKFHGCNTHIMKATHYLYDRDNPDYKNSIKESISAVESICCVIANKEHASLGDALKILEKKHKLNGQLKTAFDKLYSYTNDEGGIRHAEGLFASEVSFEEAKFMLVSCCAFINYLTAEYGKIGG